MAAEDAGVLAAIVLAAAGFTAFWGLGPALEGRVFDLLATCALQVMVDDNRAPPTGPNMAVQIAVMQPTRERPITDLEAHVDVLLGRIGAGFAADVGALVDSAGL